MAAGVKILHKRKEGPFGGGDLDVGEFGVDITNSDIYFSVDGTTVVQIDPSGTGTVTSTGTTVDGQIAVFTGQDDIEGTASLVFDGTDLKVGALGNKVLDAGDTTAVGQGWFIDENDMSSDDDTKVPSQQSVKAYVDSAVTSQVTYQGAYDASTTSPTATSVGEMYTVTVGGTGGSYFTATLEVGDVIISESASPTTEADWTVVQKNESGVATTAATLAQFTATTSAQLAGVISDETGSAGGGLLVFSNGPTLVTPDLGTPSAATLTNATGLPVSTGISGLGAGIATFLATPSSANLFTAVTGKTGNGSLVFSDNAVLTAPQINDTSADHQYIFGVSELTANRTVTLPLLAGNDIFVFEAHTQTLSNKTISDDGSTIDGGLIT